MFTSARVENRVVAGRYRLSRVVGRGGMGVLWAADDLTLSREVAVKEVRLPADGDGEEDSRLRERALREARAAARITHPSAVTVYDVVEEDGRPWIVLELLPPRTLADVLAADGPLAPRAAAHLGLQLLDALTAAHAAGVVHRDVKPSNVLFARGRAVLVDFGIASLDGDPSTTDAGALLGSPAFMAPERARGEQPTPASDLWSLGATLFTAVEGQPPFRREGYLPTLAAVVTQDAPPAEHAGPLRPVLAGLLAREPGDRPTAGRARALLQAVASAPSLVADRGDVDETVASPPAPPARLPSPFHLGRRRPGRAGAIAAAALAPVAVFALAAGLPLPWRHSALPIPSASVQGTGTAVEAAASPAARAGAAGTRSGSGASRSSVRALVSVPAVPGSSTRDSAGSPGHDTSAAAGRGDGHRDGDHGDTKSGPGKVKGSGKGHGGGNA
jgi:eukaryotic-like serine/threonine-protein kinase